MATIHNNGGAYGTLGTTATLTGAVVTQRNKKKTSASKEIIGASGDVVALVLYNKKTETTTEGYVLASATGGDLDIGGSSGEGSTFVDSVNRSFSAEDVAKVTMSATFYQGLT